MSRQLALWAFTIAMLIYATLSAVRIIWGTAPDFAIHYAAARTRSFSSAVHMLPPPSILVYMPLLLLPYKAAQTLWVIVSLLLLPTTVWFMLRLIGNETFPALLVATGLAFLSFPVRFTLGMGQVNLIALFLFVASIYQETKKHSRFAGILMGLSILFKPELIVLLSIFFWVRRWLFLISSLGILAASTLVASVIWGTDAFQSYASHMGASFGLLAGRAVYYNQALSGFVARLGVTSWFEYLYIGSTVLLLGVSVWFVKKRNARFPDIVWVSLPFFIVLEPIAWQHHLVFLLPTYLWLWKKIRDKKWYMILGASYILTAVNIKDPSAAPPIFLSHGLWGTVLLLFVGAHVL